MKDENMCQTENSIVEKKKWGKPWFLVWAVLVIGIYFAISNGLMLIAYQVVPMFIRVQPKQINTYLFVTDLVNSVILLFLVWLVYRKVTKGETEVAKPLDGKILIKCILCGLALAGLGFLIFLVGGSQGGKVPKGIDLIGMYITSVFFAPILEEMLFRGIIFKLISKFKGGWFAILLSAVVFGAYHMNMLQGILTFVMGIALAYAYDKTKSLKAPILIHLVNNLLVCITASGLPTNVQNLINWGSVVMILPFLVCMVAMNKKKA